MAELKTTDKQILEKLFQMRSGYVLDFTDRTMEEFFADELSINIYDEKYNYDSGSKANRMRGFWKVADNKTVGRSILKLVEYIETKVFIIGDYDCENYPEYLILEVKNIAQKLVGNINENIGKQDINIEANIINGKIYIILNKEVFSHVQGLLSGGHYFNAIEEAYKIVRHKLKEITGKEKAHEAFKKENYSIIFGHEAKNDAETDFFEGVKFLNMAIQNLRNEKAHTPAEKVDKNLAIHYIVLASLAYDLISRN